MGLLMAALLSTDLVADGGGGVAQLMSQVRVWVAALVPIRVIGVRCPEGL